jgi:hypothetical protein
MQYYPVVKKTEACRKLPEILSRQNSGSDVMNANDDILMKRTEPESGENRG